MLQGLLFDVDGTLADTEEIHRQAFNQTFRESGLAWEWTPPLYEELLVISGGKERIQHYALGVDPALVGRADFPDFVRTLHGKKTALYARLLCSGHVRLRPGVERLLLEARGTGLTLGLASSSAWSNVRTLLDNNLGRDWQSWFAAIETCDSVTEMKPSPAVYQAAVRRMHIDPRYCVAFEDTENGLKAALGAGLATVITTHRFTRNHAFVGAALVLNGLGEPEQPVTVVRGVVHRPYIDLAVLERVLVDYRDPGSTNRWVQQQIAFA
ncbi:MAG: HAD-IA family hydrolase [Gammaproteobacteria bacterium]